MDWRRRSFPRYARHTLVALVILLHRTPCALGDEFVFGMSTALTGPAAELGLNVKAGVDAAFQEVNAQGGIQGKTLRLIALDDGYEPTRTGPNMHQLIDQHRALAIIGNVGTPTAVVAVPIANRFKTLLFGAFTGAGVLRKTPPDRYVINVRASYAEETAAMVDGLINDVGLRPQDIAFFTQRDAYGDAGYSGGIEALRRHGLLDESKVAHGRYERNTDAVENGLADIIMSYPPPRAVIMVGAYRPCALFIDLARQSGLDSIFLNVSFVGAEPLRQALNGNGEGVVITQVVPHYTSELPIAQDYLKALKESDDDAIPSFGSFEGYIDAQVLLRALRTIDGPVDRESLIDALEELRSFDIGLEERLELSASAHQACHAVWPTVIRENRIEPLTWSSLKNEVSH
jgi:branched-chain amino acid transport system substrate-binding protein